MNNEYIEKNKVYQQQISDLANYLAFAFYIEEDQDVDSDFIKREIDSLHLLDKSEKILKYFSSLEEAKNSFKFLLSVTPDIGVEVLDRL